MQLRFIIAAITVISLYGCKKDIPEFLCSCQELTNHTCFQYKQTIATDPWGNQGLHTDTLIFNLTQYFNQKGVALISPTLEQANNGNCLTPNFECETGWVYCVNAIDSSLNTMILNGFLPNN
ncbi:MAG: hypothetical protein ACI9J3_001581 [Parvicellaceae bacterium]|jgi:hypothetical protein